MTDPFTISEPRDQLYVVKECLVMDFEAPNCERVGQGLLHSIGMLHGECSKTKWKDVIRKKSGRGKIPPLFFSVPSAKLIFFLARSLHNFILYIYIHDLCYIRA